MFARRRRAEAAASGVVAGGEADVPAPTTDLAIRYRADLGVTTGATFTWANQGDLGSDADVAQSTGTAQPSVTAENATFDNQPTLDFAGGDFLQSSGLFTTPLDPVATGFTSYIVMTASTALQIFFDNNTDGSSNDINSFYSSGAFRMDAGAALTYTRALPSGVFVLCNVFGNTSSAIYVDDLDTAGATGSSGTEAMNSITVGANQAGAGSLVGSIAEILIYRDAHDAAQRAAVGAYLNDRYGLSLVLP